MPRPLIEPRRPFTAILVGWITALLPSLLLGVAVSELLPQLGQPELPIDTQLQLGLVVIFAPLVETLIMAGLLGLLLRFLPATTAALISSVAWGMAHSLVAPAWGLVVWWPFLVFSVLYVTWRRRSLLAALAIPAATHALQNLGPALLLFADRP